jgi:hypothetical protein
MRDCEVAYEMTREYGPEPARDVRCDEPASGIESASAEERLVCRQDKA